MYKSFTAALLAATAFARGDNNGIDGDNAVSTVLFADETADNVTATLTLHTYNSMNGDTAEFHGDLELKVKGNNQAGVEYGFCAQFAEAKWDCLKATTDVDPVKLADTDNNPLYGSEFKVFDMWSADPNVAIANDDSFAVLTADKSWMKTPAKSNKACVTTTAPLVDCSKVNVHWYRNFVTDSDTQDAQLANEVAEGDNVPVWGWVTVTNFSGAKTTLTGAPAEGFNPVSKAWVASLDSGNTGDADGATAMTTLAVALSAFVALF